MRYLLKILVPVAALFAASCIKNDIPYPEVRLNIAGVEGEGFTVSGIDVANRIVTLELEEVTDIRNVRIDGVSFDVDIHSTSLDRQTLIDGISVSRELTGVFDLRAPIYVTLSLYQDYEWSIVAQQTIERRFSVAGQVGATVIDPENRTATAYVPKDADLKQITVNDLRLGPEGFTRYSPSAEELSGDFTTVRFVDVTLYDRPEPERWLLYVRHTDNSVMLTQADAWSRVIWLYGAGVEGVRKGFRYRMEGASGWTEVLDVTAEGGSFSAHLAAEPGTTYEVLAYCGDEETDPVRLTTDPVQQLPNSGMEEWSHPKSPWLPFFAEEDAYWGSGNNGATTLGAKYNVTTPYGTGYDVGDDAGDDPQSAVVLRPGTPGKTAARLKSRFVAIKLAAGNIFVGKFAGIRGGTHGVVNFGRPFTLRPTALKVWVKYTRGDITDIGSVPLGTSLQKGDPDNGSIYVALGTWTKEEYGYAKGHELLGTDESPVSIDTRDVTTFFDSKGKDVIGFGQEILTESVGEWKQITIPIDYRSTDEKPTHIIVVCSASRWGDYFTGSRQSVLWVDDFELVYDWVQDFETVR